VKSEAAMIPHSDMRLPPALVSAVGSGASAGTPGLGDSELESTCGGW
jgi:hypothetical protein